MNPDRPCIESQADYLLIAGCLAQTINRDMSLLRSIKKDDDEMTAKQGPAKWPYNYAYHVTDMRAKLTLLIKMESQSGGTLQGYISNPKNMYDSLEEFLK